MNTDTLKKQAAIRAVDLIQSGMVIGLGSGSTVTFALEEIASRLHNRQIERILGVPSSVETDRIARQLKIPLTSLGEHPQLEITIDGADEVDPQLNLIKGGGGALLREKIVAQASRRFVVIVDSSKLTRVLGRRWAVPVEVVPFGWGSQARFMESLGGRPMLRRTPQDEVFKTDQGNFIIDLHMGPIEDPRNLGLQLKSRAGIVEHGLFVDLASDVIAAGPSGLQHLHAQEH